MDHCRADGMKWPCDVDAIRNALAAPPQETPRPHPRTYSLVGSPHLFLVTDDESGMTIGYANEVGGPLVAPPLRGETPPGPYVEGTSYTARRLAALTPASPSPEPDDERIGEPPDPAIWRGLPATRGRLPASPSEPPGLDAKP